MPGLQQYLADHNESLPNFDDGIPEPAKLWFPLAVPLVSRFTVGSVRAVETVIKLRQYRCFESLASLRRYLSLRTRMILDQSTKPNGHRLSTRSQKAFSSVLDQANNTAQRYRRDRKAILELCGRGDWEQ
ncbi:hypothetical protein BT96DRAFT_828063 [Gymnopus androsaceus JB14]|uniref:Uncharacterized protein n=1 Tax=Gymnopus androsaceus JB14 TaxID=1447944 RepID=A0A6A4H7K5_9AGAR|nr:hypothetical protein BT96DRAFT_828063 [Gymnopus androsaceus JB14]